MSTVGAQQFGQVMIDSESGVSGPGFILLCCQVGAESAVKDEMNRRWPRLRFAFSRPGFLTYKLPEGHGLLADFDLGIVFARCWAFSLGTVRGADPAEMARDAWGIYGERPCRRMHVWERDAHPAGEHDFAPSVTPAARTVHAAILKACPRKAELAEGAADAVLPARRGELVLDCVMVEPDEWWIGYHRAWQPATCWPGGIPPLRLPPHAVSRAWLKTEEGLRWAGFMIQAGTHVVELGSSPGGSSQALLARDLEVMGVDPGAMDPSVLGEARFTHLRRRVRQVRRREFRKARWLLADMNVAPSYTLDTIEAIVGYPQVSIQGMLLTLKLPNWDLAAEL
ncbi:MAG: SAM-dependent methyltransferase, partial [Patescibacteria group bacterium]|nr:SAM-dependent methyltransferase [Patescibacteria group bacterium]